MINVGTCEDLTIRELAETITEVVGYKGKFMQDTAQLDGTMRKLLDVGLINRLDWKAKPACKKAWNCPTQIILLEFRRNNFLDCHT